MKYMLFICADPDVKLTPAEQDEARSGTESWVAEMDGRGVRLQGDRLRPVSDADRARPQQGGLDRRRAAKFGVIEVTTRS